MKSLLRRAISFSGYEVNRKSESSVQDLRGYPISPTPVEGFYLGEVSRYIVDVPLSIVGTTRLMRHWVSTLKVYTSQGECAAKKHLQDYYDRFQPRNVADYLQIQPNHQWRLGHPMSYIYPWDLMGPESKMEFYLDIMRKEAREHGCIGCSVSDGWKSFGPVSSRILDIELMRLLETFQSIRKHGFDEKRGYVLGRIYAWESSEMVLPRRGWHRVAICLALGMEKIPMLFDRRHAIIRYEDADKWPNVRNGYFSTSEACEIFEKRFSSKNVFVDAFL